MSTIFSGIRPSGRLHLGNYLGAIKNWITLQNQHECIFGIVDEHAITTPFEPAELRKNVYETALDYLAVGLDPKKAIFMLQSRVPEHLELAWIFSCIAPLSWFEKVPTFKDKVAQHPKYVHLGLLAYPALMAADILIYKANLVPVGEDQLPHIELVNMIGKRFNNMFCGGKRLGFNKKKPSLEEPQNTFFPLVQPLLTPGARIMSLKDPLKKMSKTPPPVAHTTQTKPLLQRDGSGQAGDDSCIFLSDSPEEIRRKVKTAVTDSGRDILAREDKPALTNLLTIYSEVSNVPIAKLEKKYQGKGYGDFKKDLAEEVVKFLEPIQKRRKQIKKEYVEGVLEKGSEKARAIAQKTLAEVKKMMGLM